MATAVKLRCANCRRRCRRCAPMDDERRTRARPGVSSRLHDAAGVICRCGRVRLSTCIGGCGPLWIPTIRSGTSTTAVSGSRRTGCSTPDVRSLCAGRRPVWPRRGGRHPPVTTDAYGKSLSEAFGRDGRLRTVLLFLSACSVFSASVASRGAARRKERRWDMPGTSVSKYVR